MAISHREPPRIFEFSVGDDDALRNPPVMRAGLVLLEDRIAILLSRQIRKRRSKALIKHFSRRDRHS